MRTYQLCYTVAACLVLCTVPVAAVRALLNGPQVLDVAPQAVANLEMRTPTSLQTSLASLTELVRGGGSNESQPAALRGAVAAHQLVGEEWLESWLKETFQEQLQPDDFPLGLARDLRATANRLGPYLTHGEDDTLNWLPADVVEALHAMAWNHHLPAEAQGFRALLSDVLTSKECSHFRTILQKAAGTAAQLQKGAEVSILPEDFPQGVLERARAAVTATVKHRNSSIPVFVSAFGHSQAAAARGPVQFLSAQVIRRDEGGLFGGHVDSSSWWPPTSSRVPMRHNSLSAFTTDIFLSDPNSYGGGEIEFLQPPLQALKRSQGDAVLFASDVSNPHRVRPVTAGSRYALVIWWHDDPALAPLAETGPFPDVSQGVNPHLERASQLLQKVSHLEHTKSIDTWKEFLNAARDVPSWK